MPVDNAMIETKEDILVDLVVGEPVKIRHEVARNWYIGCKRFFDFVLALAMLTVAAPVMAICVFLVRLTSRGPGFYSQARIGLNGRVYLIFKVRTMYHDCEKNGGAIWSQAGDPRVTPLGRFLRRTHLDELPQLWNVLKGEMSLVGPRPERPEFIPTLAQAIPRYRERLSVRPGVTGLAQVQLPPDTDLDSVSRKLAYDLHYAQHLTLWLDLRLLLATAGKVLGIPFRFTGRMLHLPCDLAAESVKRTPDERGRNTVVKPKPALQKACR